MVSFKDLAEQYAEREDLHTEDGEYSKTTIVNAYYDGAMTAIQTIFFEQSLHTTQGRVTLTNEDREWLIEQIKNNG